MKINIDKMIRSNDLYYLEKTEVLGMEFIKMNNGKYMIKNSNGRVVDEKEKLQLENKELIIKDIKSNKCQEKATKKIANNKKRIKEIDEDIKETKSTKE